jgi:hypothetical protein
MAGDVILHCGLIFTFNGYAGAILVIVPFAPRYLSAPSSTYNIPPPAGFTDGTTEALAIAITPCSPVAILATMNVLRKEGHLGCGLARLEIELAGWVGRIRTRECHFE